MGFRFVAACVMVLLRLELKMWGIDERIGLPVLTVLDLRQYLDVLIGLWSVLWSLTLRMARGRKTCYPRRLCHVSIELQLLL